MSYVNLFGFDRWTEQDHVNRTEAIVRRDWPLNDELILSRKMQGAKEGRYTMTSLDLADMEDFNQVSVAAQMAGYFARLDAALLNATLDAEPSYLRLRQPVLEPVYTDPEDTTSEVLNQGELDADAEERATAQAVVDAASVEVTDLLLLRNPLPEPVKETVEETTAPAV